MATNFLYPFANASGANVVSGATWQAYGQRTTGFQSGIAKSEYCNYAFAQGGNPGHAIGQLIVDYAEKDATLDPDELYENLKTGIVELVKRQLKADFLESAYPVGSIYCSVNKTSPEKLFGGTWEALDQGRVLVGAGDKFGAGTTGGEFTHAISSNEMPSHSHAASVTSAGGHAHTVSGSTSWSGDHAHDKGSMEIWGQFDGNANDNNSVKQGAFRLAATGSYGADGNKGGGIIDFKASRHWTGWTSTNGRHSHSFSVTSSSSGGHSHSVTIGANGGGAAMSLVQPYLSVYMWKRTA